jgi:enoyl-CoA hydratase/carnithine racemase
MSEFVLVERPADRVAHVIFNRPERRNALIGPMATQLADTLEELNTDGSVSVVVLRGAGGAFCSGLDLKEFARDPRPDWVATFGDEWRRVHRALYDCPHVLVGALERYGINGGAAPAFACDFLVVGETSFLQVGEIQQGMPAPMNMAWLGLRFSEAVRARVALLGDRIHGPELLSLGIAYASVPDDEVVEAADELALKFAAHDPNGVSAIKRSLRFTSFTGTASEWFDRPLQRDGLDRDVRPVEARDT